MLPIGSLYLSDRAITAYQGDENIYFELSEINCRYNADPAECLAGFNWDSIKTHLLSVERDDIVEHYISPLGLLVIADHWGNNELISSLIYQVIIPGYAKSALNSEKLDLLGMEEARKVHRNRGLLARNPNVQAVR
jgi:hypothetical protein